MASIEQRPGNFSKNAKGKMFISQQTYEGFKITVNSIIEAVQFLLQHEVSYVLMESFCQDPLKNYFGHQRSLGARKDNPSLWDFGLNDNAIRNQMYFDQYLVMLEVVKIKVVLLNLRVSLFHVKKR